MPRGGGGTGMPTEAWLFACGFRTVIGKLLKLTLPVGDPMWVLGDEGVVPIWGVCRVLICGGVDATFKVDFHTGIIGLQPTGHMNGGLDPVYHSGELVQVNLRARSPFALSIERYFSNVSHQSNTMEA